MSENLIYGADICAYGAVGDGKTDCTDAFIKAINNGESLISVPFGIFKITGEVVLSSNTKIHLHPRAVLEFDNKDGSLFKAKDASNIIICGGSIKSKTKKLLIEFDTVSAGKIFDISLDGGILLSGCEDIKINRAEFTGAKCSSIAISGECEDIKVKNCFFDTKKAFVEICDGADVEELTISNTKGDMCCSFIKIGSCKTEELECCDIICCFSDSFLETTDGTILEDADFENLTLSYLDYVPDKKDGAYFKLLGKIDGLEIEHFKRSADIEANPSVPSIILSPNSDTAMILDGTGLDNVINARGASKTATMTTAKLQNPTGKFIYTFECGITAGDTFTMPLGDFDFVSIYEK